MNFIQSPPRFGNKSLQNGNIEANNGNFRGLHGNYLWGGLKTK